MRYRKLDIMNVVIKIVIIGVAAVLIMSFGGIWIYNNKPELYSGKFKPDIREGYINISTMKDLKTIQNDLQGKYILTNDIKMARSDSWIPIGTEEAPFSGVFDGNGYTISGLSCNISSSKSENSGLFGTVDGGIIRNLTIEDGYIRLLASSDDITFSNGGGIAGIIRNNSKIENCTYSGKVTVSCKKNAFARVGGIAAGVTDSRIINCRLESDLFCSSENGTVNSMAGGITAWLSNSVVENCCVLGNINANSDNSYTYVGGISASGDNGKVKQSVVMLNSVEALGVETYVDGISAFAEKEGNYINDNLDVNMFEKCPTITFEEFCSASFFQQLGWDMKETWNLSENGPIVSNNHVG